MATAGSSLNLALDGKGWKEISYNIPTTVIATTLGNKLGNLASSNTDKIINQNSSKVLGEITGAFVSESVTRINDTVTKKDTK